MTRNEEQHLRSDILSQHDRWATRKKERRKMERKRRKIERKKKKDGKKRNPWCDDCNAKYQGDCPQCGPLTVTNDLLWKGNYLKNDYEIAIRTRIIVKRLRFGPYNDDAKIPAHTPSHLPHQ